VYNGESFLKWAGSKLPLLPKIIPLLGEGRVLVEPFVGSAVVSLNASQFPVKIIGDSNRDLVSLYSAVVGETNKLIDRIKLLFTPENNAEDVYYQLRDVFNLSEQNSLIRSSLFVYLNKHGFNGLCRYNRSGGYNVPFGFRRRPDPEIDRIMLFVERMKHSKIVHGDFADLMLRYAEPGVTIYCDPPYIPLSSTSSFTSYDGCGFGEYHQRRLAAVARECAKMGARVVVSNSDTPLAHEIYAGAQSVERVSVRRNIAANPDSRGNVDELLIVL
jgi:DNA adenine methylase